MHRDSYVAPFRLTCCTPTLPTWSPQSFVLTMPTVTYESQASLMELPLCHSPALGWRDTVFWVSLLWLHCIDTPCPLNMLHWSNLQVDPLKSHLAVCLLRTAMDPHHRKVAQVGSLQTPSSAAPQSLPAQENPGWMCFAAGNLCFRRP